MTPNPFFSIWTEPRRTVRRITIEKPSFLVWPLAILSGIDKSFHSTLNNYRGTPPPWTTVVAMALVIGVLSGPLYVWLGAYLLRWTGQLMDGGASLRRLRTALAWGAVPALVSLLLWIPRLLAFGTHAFTGGPLRYGGSPMDKALVSVLALVDMVLAILSLVLVCNTVAEVQGFRSAWQGFANLFLAGLAAAVPIIALIVAIVLVTHKF